MELLSFIVVLNFLMTFYLWFTKVSHDEIKDCEFQTQANELYRAYIRPMAEEYRQLKGYDLIYVSTDYTEFQKLDKQGRINFHEAIENSKLKKRLEQLKADMKRGCEFYCKEKNEAP
jgi:hypothetical protein